MNTRTLQLVGCSAAGTFAGAAATFIGARVYFKKHYEEIANAEIASVKKSYASIQKQAEYADPADAVAAYSAQSEEAASIEVAQTVKIFDDDDAIRKLEEHLNNGDFGTVDQIVTDGQYSSHNYQRNRVYDSSRPNVISKEAYFDDSNEFDKLTVTYYEGDDTLCSATDVPFANIEDIIGRDSLDHFGMDSGDKNIVYVRNERLQADYEVILNPDEYVSVVLGIRDADKIRRMRDDE